MNNARWPYKTWSARTFCVHNYPVTEVDPGQQQVRLTKVVEPTSVVLAERRDLTAVLAEREQDINADGLVF